MKTRKNDELELHSRPKL